MNLLKWALHAYQCTLWLPTYIFISVSLFTILHQVLGHRPNVSLDAHCRPGAFSDMLALTVVVVNFQWLNNNAVLQIPSEVTVHCNLGKIVLFFSCCHVFILIVFPSNLGKRYPNK
jgi:hypothetical protein